MRQLKAAMANASFFIDDLQVLSSGFAEKFLMGFPQNRRGNPLPRLEEFSLKLWQNCDNAALVLRCSVKRISQVVERIEMVHPAGFEPTTPGLGKRAEL